MKIRLRPVWRETLVSVYDFYFLVFLLALTLGAYFYPAHPVTAVTLRNLPVFTPQSYTLLATLAIVALAWRRWIGAVRLLFLMPTILYTFTLVIFGLPTVGKPSDFIIAAVLIGWMPLFIRG